MKSQFSVTCMTFCCSICWNSVSASSPLRSVGWLSDLSIMLWLMSRSITSRIRVSWSVGFPSSEQSYTFPTAQTPSGLEHSIHREWTHTNTTTSLHTPSSCFLQCSAAHTSQKENQTMHYGRCRILALSQEWKHVWDFRLLQQYRWGLFSSWMKHHIT
jgi:hypothetical protein